MSAEVSTTTIPWRGVRFGLGLLEIGRPWGPPEKRVPGWDAALKFLAGAYGLGVRLFDTAASYGDSEEKFGAFLRDLPAEGRRELMIATKFGEHWDARTQAPYADHSYDALCRSLDRSYELLGRVDILQVHKTSPEVLRSPELHAALDEAQRRGVRLVGASTSDPQSAEAAMETGRFGQLQMPFSRGDQRLAPALEEARARGLLVFTNRPFQVGQLLDGSPAAVRGCIEAVLQPGFDGAVLFGTRTLEHLRENWIAFHEASGK
jgi:aryl-alcohol dehydrogenase-like predicted oxidoreductase